MPLKLELRDLSIAAQIAMNPALPVGYPAGVPAYPVAHGYPVVQGHPEVQVHPEAHGFDSRAIGKFLQITLTLGSRVCSLISSLDVKLFVTPGVIDVC